MKQRVLTYFDVLGSLPLKTHTTDATGRTIAVEVAFEQVIAAARGAHEAGRKLMFVGNGGSAGISSHLAIDFLKNGGMRAMSFNDGAALTCLGNDLGYENVFAFQIGMHAVAGDVLIAISSSGRSPNILKAVEAARERGCAVVTFSGFDADNPLRRMGDVNFYVPASAYGFVEVTHLALCHCVLDLAMGWRLESGAE